MRREHPFEDVDRQAEPSAWVGVLDRLRAEPAYSAYKRRIPALLAPRRGGRYLEVGTGTGADALALRDRFDVSVVGVDSSAVMLEEARRRGLATVVLADAHALPFESEEFDGAWADRTFQHLADPQTALRELVRVTERGGRVVLADPDYETQFVSVCDQELARRVLRFRADLGLRNGTLAHQMARLFVEEQLSDVRIEAVPVVVRDPAALDNVMGIRDWAATAREARALEDGDVARWREELDAAVDGGYFVYGFTIFVTSGTKMPRSNNG